MLTGGGSLLSLADAQNIYTSTDSGATWVEQEGLGHYSGVATFSADGTKIATAAYSGNIYTSLDSGATWTEQTGSGARFWKTLSMSADGTKLIATVDGNHGSAFLYTSVDSGVTWVEQVAVGGRQWTSANFSADGTKIIATATTGDYTPGPDYIYTSSDAGTTWTRQSGVPAYGKMTTSFDGSKVVLGSNTSAKVYISTDFTATWTELVVPGSSALGGIDASSDGSTLIIATGGQLVLSEDSGATWVEQSGTEDHSWTSVAVSADGEKFAAADGDRYIYTATAPVAAPVPVIIIPAANVTYGSRNSPTVEWSVDWEVSETCEYSYDGVSYDEVDCSEGGTDIPAPQSRGAQTLYVRGTNALGATIVSVNFTYNGSLWIQQTNSGSRSWRAIAGSNNGRTLVVAGDGAPPFTSTDSGYTWIERAMPEPFGEPGGNNWVALATSGNGTKMVGLLGNGDGSDGIGSLYRANLYTSTDSGATWVEQTNSANFAWRAVDISNDGMDLVAIGYGDDGLDNYGGHILTSSDGGETWIVQQGAGMHRWASVTMSANGEKIVAVAKEQDPDTFETLPGYIYTSTDGGVTWTERTGAGERFWTDVTSSQNGVRVAAVDGNNGYVYTSNDSGVTWTQRTGAGARPWTAIDASANGQRLVAVGTDTYVYISDDSGATWVEQVGSGARDWKDVFISGNGEEIAVADGSN